MFKLNLKILLLLFIGSILAPLTLSSASYNDTYSYKNKYYKNYGSKKTVKKYKKYKKIIRKKVIKRKVPTTQAVTKVPAEKLTQEAPKEIIEPDNNVESKNYSTILGFKGNYFIGSDLVMRSLDRTYNIATTNQTDSTGQIIQMKLGPTGDIFDLNGQNKTFKASKSNVGLDLKGGFKAKNGDKYFIDLYNESELVALGIGYEFAIPSLTSNFATSLIPYLNFGLGFGYESFGDMAKILSRAISYDFGIGARYIFTQDLDFSVGYKMGAASWSESSDEYISETWDDSFSTFYLNSSYSF